MAVVARVQPLAARVGPSRGATLAAGAAFEMGSVLLPALLVVTIGATPAALGIVEGLAIGLSVLGRLVGGAVVHERGRRRAANIGGYAGLTVMTTAMAAAGSAAVAGIFRAGAWIAAGLRAATTSMDIVESAPAQTIGREFGAERGADHLGSGVGAALAIVFVAALSVRAALALAIVPGTLAIVAALRARLPAEAAAPPEVPSLRAASRLLYRGPLAWTFASIATLEAANISFTLLILRATKLLEQSHTVDSAVLIALVLFLGYRLAAMASSIAGGRAIDAAGPRRPMIGGALALLAAYAIFAETGGGVASIAIAFLLAGAGVGIAETAEHVAVTRLAPPEARALAFGTLTAIQSAGRLFASIVAGVLWTVVAPAAGLLVTAPLLVLCVALLIYAEARASSA